jgi:hypothetical protein
MWNGAKYVAMAIAGAGLAVATAPPALPAIAGPAPGDAVGDCGAYMPRRAHRVIHAPARARPRQRIAGPHAEPELRAPPSERKRGNTRI